MIALLFVAGCEGDPLQFKLQGPKKCRSTTGCNIEKYVLLVCLMVFNATFNNISVISWRSVLFVEETGVPGENH